MKQPDEKPTINMQEHLKISINEKISNGNGETETTKIIICQRVK